MSRNDLRRSLRIVLPSLVVFLAVAGSLASYLILDRFNNAESEAQAIESATVSMTELLNRVEKGIQRDDPEMVQSVISQMSMRVDVKSAILLDEKNNVVAATRRDWIKQPFDPGALGLDAGDSGKLKAAITTVRDKLSSVRIFTNGRNGLLACYPAALPLGRSELEVRYNGVLLSYFDLTYVKADGIRRLRTDFGLFLATILAIAIGLGVSLHYLVTRRLERLESDMVRFAAGEPVPETETRHRDEIALLDAQFKDIARKVGQSIAERRKAEEFLRTVIEDQTEMILRWKTDGTRTFVNAAYCRMFGGSAEELIGKNFLALLSEYDRTILIDRIRSLTPDMPVATSVVPVVPRKGELRWQEWTDRGMFDDEGRLVELQSTGRDVTERKKIEDKIWKLNTELEQRVAERTAELTASNKELEAFSYSVSHDLRTPLRNISGFVAMLQNNIGPVDGKAARYFATITSEAKRMGQLIDDLLALSRVGRTEIRKSSVDLNQLVQETRQDLSMETRERRIEWTLDPLPMVEADPGLLRQVLMNLLSNAIKYTRRQDPATIHVGVAAPAPGRAEIVIFIRDNGVGFDMKHADKLFGVFQRLHSAKQFEGTGIGLANVHRIIERHGGRVWVDAETDRGATFYFSLPVSTPDFETIGRSSM